MKTPRLSAQTVIHSPLGPLTLAASDKGLALVWFEVQAHRSAEVDAPEQPEHPHLRQAADELAAYFADAQAHFAVPLDPQGTPFQQAVWQVLRGIPPGRLSSYGEVARAVGRPAAARAWSSKATPTSAVAANTTWRWARSAPSRC